MKKILSKKEKAGITLIALIITIIVLIILAAISINIIAGDNGIIKKAKYVKELYKTRENEENTIISNYDTFIEELGKNVNGARQLSNEEISNMINQAVENRVESIINEKLDDYTTKEEILNKTYPVGSIYISIDSTNPSSLFGGEWEQVSRGRTLFGEGTLNGITYTANTTVNAGLPNITGTINLKGIEGVSGSTSLTTTKTGTWNNTHTNYGYDGGIWRFNLDASNSSAIYGASTTVQPNAYVTYMWKRIS